MRPAYSRNILCAASLLLAALAPLPSHAETLDEASIRALYHQAESNIRDGAKTRRFMEERLDPTFMLKSNVVLTIGGNPPKQMQKFQNKSEAIASAVAGFAASTIKDYDYKVIHIEYSDDKKYAFVSETVATTGTMDVPNDRSILPVPFTDAEGCTDMLSLVEGKIKILQSACNDRLTLQK